MQRAPFRHHPPVGVDFVEKFRSVGASGDAENGAETWDPVVDSYLSTRRTARAKRKSRPPREELDWDDAWVGDTRPRGLGLFDDFQTKCDLGCDCGLEDVVPPDGQTYV